MSMILYLGTIKREAIDGLLAAPEGIHELLEQLDDTGIDLDKNWHAIHYLLTGDADAGEEPAAYLAGGEEVGEEDVGYGPARVLRPEEVREFSDFLQTVDAAEMRRRFDPAALTKAEIYPLEWNGAEDLDWLIETYEMMCAFFAEAAAREEGVVLSLS
jgi:Domain of unknown function (DUF1877)